MERSVLVFADLGGVSHLTGRLWSRARRGQETPSFEYDKNWLAHPERFALEPALTLGPDRTTPGRAKPSSARSGIQHLIGGAAC